MASVKCGIEDVKKDYYAFMICKKYKKKHERPDFFSFFSLSRDKKQKRLPAGKHVCREDRKQRLPSGEEISQLTLT